MCAYTTNLLLLILYIKISRRHVFPRHRLEIQPTSRQPFEIAVFEPVFRTIRTVAIAVAPIFPGGIRKVSIRTYTRNIILIIQTFYLLYYNNIIYELCVFQSY